MLVGKEPSQRQSAFDPLGFVLIKRLPVMYSFSSPQTVYFGRGSSKKTIALAAQYGTKVLVVHGANVDRVHWLIMACTTADLTTKKTPQGDHTVK